MHDILLCCCGLFHVWMGGENEKKKSNVFSSCVNFLRVKAAPQSQKPTVRKSATRMVCPTPSVTQTLNTCPAPWRQNTGRTLITALYIHTHTHIHSQLSRKLPCFNRLLKAMGWQEYPENDDNFLPLTEDELREFHTKTEQVSTKRNVRCHSFALWLFLVFNLW